MTKIINGSLHKLKPTNRELWEKLREKVEFGASYYATADDLALIIKLIADLGSIGTKAYINTYGGKPHIILKGRPGLRKILTAPRYGVTNPKVVSMGLGRVGATAAAKAGGALTIILLTPFVLLTMSFATKN